MSDDQIPGMITMTREQALELQRNALIKEHDTLTQQLVRQEKIIAAYNHDYSELEAMLLKAGFTEFDHEGEYKGLLILLPELLAQCAALAKKRLKP